ncbi:hypothetical protein KFK09_016250 [Dendrobium nobile]|uniref:Uncharacterized protein n=1 Tax=Dendrobium nobile TaxID=94219 RepID=A0A8T3AXH3_DENNO|nr:hypothetical protein KFK09_016250 [Dendrobium nobile]
MLEKKFYDRRRTQYRLFGEALLLCPIFFLYLWIMSLQKNYKYAFIHHIRRKEEKKSYRENSLTFFSHHRR